MSTEVIALPGFGHIVEDVRHVDGIYMTVCRCGTLGAGGSMDQALQSFWAHAEPLVQDRKIRMMNTILGCGCDADVPTPSPEHLLVPNGLLVLCPEHSLASCMHAVLSDEGYMLWELSACPLTEVEVPDP